jgi:hypothetical protein
LPLRYCTGLLSFSCRRLSNIRLSRNHSSSFSSCKSSGGGSGRGLASHANALSTWGSDSFCNTFFSYGRTQTASSDLLFKRGHERIVARFFGFGKLKLKG